jgi:hypothetical protein
MNQYRCETCENFSCIFCPKRLRKEGTIIIYHSKPALFTAEYGCASHSDFQSERDKVLEEAYNKIYNLSYKNFNLLGIKNALKELQMQVGDRK